MRPSSKKGSAKSLWSGHSVDRSAAQDEQRRAQMAVQVDKRFSAVVGFRIAKREPALAEKPKTCGGPLFGAIRLRRIAEFDYALVEPRRAAYS